MSKNSLGVINNNLTSVLKEALTSGSEFWDATKTLKVLAEEDYFKDDEDKHQWPGDLKGMIAGGM
jgi:DNA mismatch repair protein MSH6